MGATAMNKDSSPGEQSEPAPEPKCARLTIFDIRNRIRIKLARVIEKKFCLADPAQKFYNVLVLAFPGHVND
jgi:hypothetical protein